MTWSALQPAVVLVADRTLSADYRILFEGIFATMQTRHVPEPAMRRLLSPPVKTNPEGRAHTAPLGLRRVEAALRTDANLESADVVCTTPEQLPSLLGPWVRIVAVSSSDPLGHGMSNTTTRCFWPGELYTRFWMRQLLEQILQAKRKYGFVVIGGGAGAWQWRSYPDPTADQCLDYIFEGYFEKDGPPLFQDILHGTLPPQRVIVQPETAAEGIRPVRGATLMGSVELSRGCGRGCRFCSMARKPMRHLPAEMILQDLETNLACGVRSVVSGSEDFFRYGAGGVRPEFDKLRSLLEQMRRLQGLSFMQIDHANITSIAQLSDAQLQEIRRLLTWEKKSRYLWVNMGAESAAGHLVAASAPGKMAPFRPDDWEGLLYETAERMTRNDYFGVFSLVLGLPGETGEDIARTRKFVRFLQRQNAVVFPVFYEPYQPEEIAAQVRFTTESMRPDHLDLYRACYEINFRKVPLLYWDNQRCGGVPWIKRALIRILGKTEIFAWRSAFRKLEKKQKFQTRERKTRYASAG